MPTITTGSNIDKMLFIPGRYIPATLFAPDAGIDGEAGQGFLPQYYPAEIIPAYALSSHFPLLLQIPADETEIAKGEGRLAVGSWTDAQWAEKDEQLSTRLTLELPLHMEEGVFAPSNFDQYYHEFEHIVKSVFKDQTVYKRVEVTENTLYNFLIDNSRHPNIDDLIKAIQ